MSLWHQRGPGRGENAPWSGAGKVEVSQSCTWSCKEGPVPQGCLPVVPWDGNRNSPQFHPPNSEKALFASKGRIMAIMALQGQLHSPGICKVTRNTRSGKSLLLFTVWSLRHPTSIADRRWGEMFTINNVYFGLFSPVWVWGQRRWCCLADLFMFRRRVEEGGVYPWSRWLFQAALEESAHLIGIQSASLVPISQ